MSALFWLTVSEAHARGQWWLPGSFWSPEAATTYAERVDAIYYFIYWTSVVFFIFMMGATAWFMLAYRQRGENDKTHPTHGSTALEVSWAVFPSFLLVMMFWFGWQTWMDLNVAPADSLEIHVTGQKWVWSYSYPSEGLDVAGTYPDSTNVKPLVVPAGKPVSLRINSVDVLHSYFVPDFRIKRDAVPNRYSYLWFEAKEPGEHVVFCTEYCGDDHSRMLSRIKVVTPEKFDAWIQEQKAANSTEGLAAHEAGEKYFNGKGGCAACHNVNGVNANGPHLNNKFGAEEVLEGGEKVLVDANYVRNSIVNPAGQIVQGFGNIMPPYKGRISDKELSNVIEYIKSIGVDADKYTPPEGDGAEGGE